VRAAQEALEREAARVALVNDPIRPILRAVSLALGACHRLYVDGSLTMARLAQDSSSKPPIDKDEMRLSILNGIRATAGSAVRAITVRNWLLAACILVGSNLVTAGAMLWWHPGAPVVQQLLVSLPADLRPTNGAKSATGDRFATGRIGRNCRRSTVWAGQREGSAYHGCAVRR